MKKQFGEYYLGLDIGTNSVGWAVTDLDYNVLKLNGKALWGIRLFDEAQTAAAMRTARSGRRRISRQKWRLGLLQELLGEAIAKVDPTFFWRLKESNLQIEDKKKLKVKYSLFGDHLMTDKEYYDKYPSIYHLRKALLEGTAEAFDIRLLYLAIAHILKHRGHFLFADLNANDIKDFKNIYRDLEAYIQDNLESPNDASKFANWCCPDIDELAELLKDKFLGLSEKKKRLEKLFNTKDKQEKALLAFLSGSAAKLSDLFADESLKECAKDSFGFKKDNFEEVEPEIEKYLGSRMELIAKLKAVYDWSLLSEVLNGKKYLSQAKVAVYEEHKEDLQLLKVHAKEQGFYKAIFGYQEKAVNYSSYVGSCLLASGKKAVITKGCSQEEFCKELKKLLGKTVDFKKLVQPDKSSSAWDKLLYKINEGTALPKLRTKDNGVIPMQVHLAELECILDNAVKYFPFLAEKDGSGLSIQEKIIEIMKFRIPYYVGPLAGTELSKQKKRCWIVRKPEKIYPWNFDQVVDKEACAEKFIRNMTNKCTYLPTEDVLPKNSLLYTEFMARNELNNLALDGQRLANKEIASIYEALVLHSKGKLTKKRILNYLFTLGKVHKDKQAKGFVEELTGVDDTLQANMQSYKDFSRIFGEEYLQGHYEEIENIIRWITLFCEEKAMLIHKIHQEYPEITQAQLNEIKRLKYADWGRLSKTFLDSSKIAYVDDATGEYISIITALRRENLNLMQLLSPASKYGFAQKIEEFNNINLNGVDSVDYTFVDEMAVSPAVKRSLWQSMLIVKEIKKITGHDPKRVFIEMARGEDEKDKERKKKQNGREVSRKNALLDLYKQCKADWKYMCTVLSSYEAGPSIDDFIAKLEAKNESDLRSNKLFLYYTQLGRCMYTGTKIDLSELDNANVYDKDHIYPRSKTKDDSITRNLVLVKKELNSHKTDVYPLNPEIQKRMTPFWRMLKDKKLIDDEKYNRLTRKTPLTEAELAGFISRQIVETRQSTKAVAELLKIECPEATVVYSKASNVSDFRHEYGFVKSRSVNDFHHAKDAYLNIVVGNVYYTRFTANPYNFINKLHEGDKYTLNTREMYNRDVMRGGLVAWRAGKVGSMSTVEKIMKKNNILFTRMQEINKGQIFDLTLMKKKSGQIPIKQNLNIDNYGGYNKPASAYFMLVEYKDKKGKLIKAIEAIPIYLAERIKNDPEALIEFLKSDNEVLDLRVLLTPLRRYALVDIDGCKMHITGKTGRQLTASLACQLVLSEEWEAYVKKLDKVVEKITAEANKKDSHEKAITREKYAELYDWLSGRYALQGKDLLQPSKEVFLTYDTATRREVWKEMLLEVFDGISRKRNIELYDLLIAKHRTQAYINRPSAQVEVLLDNKSSFSALAIKEQCLVLCNILHLFSCKPITADLTLIGGSKNAGKVLFSKNITNRKQAILYNQSITGVFEQQIDLLKL